MSYYFNIFRFLKYLTINGVENKVIDIRTGAKTLCTAYAMIKLLAFSAIFGSLSAKFIFSSSKHTSSPL